MKFRFPTLAATIGASAFALSSFAALADAHELDISIAKAPVAPDGTTAGAQADFVLSYVDPDPTVDGLPMLTGGTFTVELPADFTQVGDNNNVAVLQGWPQSPRVDGPGFPYTIDIDNNVITLTMTKDWPVDRDQFGPGPKQVHLILFDFLNPGPGRYPVSLAIDPDGPAGPVEPVSGIGHVQIIPKARPSVNVVSVFSGPPGPPPPFFNPLFQTVEKGETTRQAGLYMWDDDSVPFNGVELVMTNPSHGRFVADGRTVGHVRVNAPPKARDFEVISLGPSEQFIAFLTGVPVGVMLVEFRTDPDVAGVYVIELDMNNGEGDMLIVETTD